MSKTIARIWISADALLITVMLLAALPSHAEGSTANERVFFPVGNVGWTFPNGWEATGGVLWGTTRYDSIEGPSLAARINGAGGSLGTSLGLGYIAELSLVGFGGNLWLTKYWQPGSRGLDAVGVDGYVRIVLLEVRLGLGYGWNGAPTRGLYPIFGLNLGI